MKRFFIVFLLFMMVFSPFLIPTELSFSENSNEDGQETTESNGLVKVGMFLWAEQPRNFIAELAVTKEGKGTWTYYFDGKKIGSKEGNQSIKFQTPSYQVGTPHTVKVTFAGIVDGKEVHSSEEVHLPKVSYDYQWVKEKHQFSMSLSEVSRANGRWAIFLKNEKGEIVNKCDEFFSKELTLHCPIEELDEGMYRVVFLFNGTFDQMYSFAKYSIMREGVFTVTEKGKSGVLQLKEETTSPDSDQVKSLLNQPVKKSEGLADITQSVNSSLNLSFILLGSCVALATLLILIVLKKTISNLWK